MAPNHNQYHFVTEGSVAQAAPPATGETKNENLPNQKKCLSCHERRRDIPQIDKSLEIISKIVEESQIKSSIFILNDRNEIEKSFFRYLATSLTFSESLLGSTLLYGLANKTFESYAYYRNGLLNRITLYIKSSLDEPLNRGPILTHQILFKVYSKVLGSYAHRYTVLPISW